MFRELAQDGMMKVHGNVLLLFSFPAEDSCALQPRKDGIEPVNAAPRSGASRRPMIGPEGLPRCRWDWLAGNRLIHTSSAIPFAVPPLVAAWEQSIQDLVAVKTFFWNLLRTELSVEVRKIGRFRSPNFPVHEYG
jgi:hypothetical protein